MLCTSCDGFQLASKIITLFAPVKLIPNPPALVEIKNNLARVFFELLKVLHQALRFAADDDPSNLK